MTAFLLLHGAWHGGWCWQPIAERLRAAGHRVEAPDLPGLGNFRSQDGDTFGLADHVAHARRTMDRIGGRAVVVAHSYAGMVLRALEACMAPAIEHAIYIEAVVPEPGQSLMDLMPFDIRAATAAAIRYDVHGGPVIMPPDVIRFAIPDAALAADIAGRLTPQPHATFTDKLGPAGDFGHHPRTYVYATDRVPQPYQGIIDRCRKDTGWRVHGLAGGHELMLTAADALGDILLDTGSQIAR